MGIAKTVTFVTLSAALSTVSLFPQAVISAKAGVIHYTEGDVAVVAGKTTTPVESHTGGKYTDLKEGQNLATTEGRAEVLLNPGVFLRMGENSNVKMISSRLSDTRLDLTQGVALVEVAEVAKDNGVTILVKDAAVTFSKMALVRLDAVNGVRVYKGEAQVMVDGAPQILKEGREMQFTAANAVVKFDAKVGDPLYRWANRRAEYIAMANVASAKMARNSYGSSGSMYPTMGGWFYNSYYGMMTYLPMGNGLYRSPFGYMYYSPQRVMRYYQSYVPVQPQISAGGAGMNSGGITGRGTYDSSNGYYTTAGRSAGPVMAAPSGGGAPSAAAAAPVARGADAGGARGGGGGGGRGK